MTPISIYCEITEAIKDEACNNLDNKISDVSFADVYMDIDSLIYDSMSNITGNINEKLFLHLTKHKNPKHQFIFSSLTSLKSL